MAVNAINPRGEEGSRRGLACLSPPGCIPARRAAYSAAVISGAWDSSVASPDVAE